MFVNVDVDIVPLIWILWLNQVQIVTGKYWYFGLLGYQSVS